MHAGVTLPHACWGRTATCLILFHCPIPRAHDPKNCGYVTKKDFIKCIHDHIGDNSLDTQISRLMGHLCPEGDLWVPYSKFLTMFEKVKSPVEKQLEIEKESFEAVDTAKVLSCHGCS